MADAPPTQLTSWRSALLYGAGAGVVAAFSFSTARLVASVPEPYWAPIAAVVVLYPDREATKQAVIQRLVGTAIGSIIGWGSAVWWHQSAVRYGVSIVIAMTVCSLLRLEAASRLCAVAVTVITLIPRAEAPSLVALHRCIGVTYGVVCALVYAVVVDAIRRRLAASHETLGK